MAAEEERGESCDLLPNLPRRGWPPCLVKMPDDFLLFLFLFLLNRRPQHFIFPLLQGHSRVSGPDPCCSPCIRINLKLRLQKTFGLASIIINPDGPAGDSGVFGEPDQKTSVITLPTCKQPVPPCSLHPRLIPSLCVHSYVLEREREKFTFTFTGWVGVDMQTARANGDLRNAGNIVALYRR